MTGTVLPVLVIRVGGALDAEDVRNVALRIAVFLAEFFPEPHAQAEAFASSSITCSPPRLHTSFHKVCAVPREFIPLTPEHYNMERRGVHGKCDHVSRYDRVQNRAICVHVRLISAFFSAEYVGDMRPVYALFPRKTVSKYGGKRISRNAGAAIRPRKGGAEASAPKAGASGQPRMLRVSSSFAGQRGEQQVVDALGIAVEIPF